MLRLSLRVFAVPGGQRWMSRRTEFAPENSSGCSGSYKATRFAIAIRFFSGRRAALPG